MQKATFCIGASYAMRRYITTSLETGSGETIKGQSVLTKTLIVMKLTIFLLTAAFINVYANGFSQTVTYKGKKVPLKVVMQSVKQQTGYVFLINEKLLEEAKPITVDVTNEDIHVFLERIFDGQPLVYKITHKNIIITPTVNRDESNRISSSPAIESPPITGRVTDSLGNPLAGATIVVKGKNISTSTDNNGVFTLNVSEGDVLLISFVGHRAHEAKVSSAMLSKQTIGTLRLTPFISSMNEISVYSTGFQKIPMERATGSFVMIDNKLLNRGVGKNVLDRLDGVTSGLLFNKNSFPGNNQPEISIRSRGTIYANAEALVVVDDFPYDGDLSNLNPNDIENITILKDAAAASIWGAYSGNGVIVITTKRGRYNQAAKIGLNANFSVGEKPDLFYKPVLGSSSYVELEQFLFEKGQFTGSEGSINKPVLSPVVEVLRNKRDGRISDEEAEMILDEYRRHDVRDEISKYFYRKSINQQYAINISGGSNVHQYFLSAGYDQEQPAVVGNRNNRITLNGNNTFSLLKNKMEFKATVVYTQNMGVNNGIPEPKAPWPYTKLVEGEGRALTVPADIRQSYKDTAGAGKLLDWNYKPIDELKYTYNKTFGTDIRILTGLKYKVRPDLSASVTYQFSRGNTEFRNRQAIESYFTRNYINTFSQINSQSGAVSYAVPLGDILDLTNSNNKAHNLRANVDYSRSWNMCNSLAIYAGGEVRDVRSVRSTNRVYGYDNETGTSKLVNYLVDYPMYYNNRTSRIAPNIDNTGSTDRYFSYFANASYSYDGRYTVTASARKDASNFFGVETNRKGIPLWSAGVSWEVSKEKFWRMSWLPFLKLRVTNGYNGNIDQSLSSFVTASALGVPNLYNAVQYNLTNAPNNRLRWEKVNIINFALEFAMADKALYGSIEYYYKNGHDLIGSAAFDPTSGITSFKGNIADIEGKGIDIILNADVINKRFKWTINGLFSFVSDKVTNYKLKPSTISSFITANQSINPIEGNPLYSVYAFEWVGLNPTDGNPMIRFEDKESMEYGKFLSSNNLNNLKYIGRATPAYFGSVRNNFSFWKLNLSANIVYKFGYYFKRPTVNYTELFSGSSKGHSDYDLRWQQPGDELITTIPSMVYPSVSGRDAAFANSTKFIEKGDHIRLKDLRVDLYDLFRQGSILESCSLFAMIDNVGIIWRKTRSGLDPDFFSTYPAPRVYSFGMRMKF